MENQIIKRDAPSIATPRRTPDPCGGISQILFVQLESDMTCQNFRDLIEPSLAASYGFFGQPVHVLVGLGFPRSVESVMDAYELLDDWPPSFRNAAHRMALNICKAALADEIDAETARAAFVTFARKANILSPEMDGTIADQLSTAMRGAKDDFGH